MIRQFKVGDNVYGYRKGKLTPNTSSTNSTSSSSSGSSSDNSTINGSGKCYYYEYYKIKII
jgi:hypothetical protein